MIVITTQIKMPIATIAFVPTPTQMMMRGPSAIFGKLLSTTKYGSSTRLIGVIKNKITAKQKPINVLSAKAKIVSFRVVKMCINKVPLL